MLVNLVNDASMQYAPIALFVYKRLWHTQETIVSLQKNTLASFSDLIIFSDGPKDKAAEIAVLEVREWIEKVSGFKSITIIKREENFGLAQSIIQGVTELTNKFSKVIVMEDDLKVSPYFLEFMNEGLNVYEKDERVASIHGYALPVKQELDQTYFLRGADCWGWATWKRAWDKFEPDGKLLLARLIQDKLTKQFDFSGACHYTQMLKNQIAGKFNSWAIRWHASAFVNNMLTLYPGKSLVQNIGFDNSGEHCFASNSWDVTLYDKRIAVDRIAVEEDKMAFNAYRDYFNSIRETFYFRCKRFLINKVLKKIIKKV